MCSCMCRCRVPQRRSLTRRGRTRISPRSRRPRRQRPMHMRLRRSLLPTLSSSSSLAPLLIRSKTFVLLCLSAHVETSFGKPTQMIRENTKTKKKLEREKERERKREQQPTNQPTKQTNKQTNRANQNVHGSYPNVERSEYIFYRLLNQLPASLSLLLSLSLSKCFFFSPDFFTWIFSACDLKRFWTKKKIIEYLYYN